MSTLKPVGGEELGMACASQYTPETIKDALKSPLAPGVQRGFNLVAGWFNSKVNDFERLHHLNSLKDRGAFQGKCRKNILLLAKGTSEFDFSGLGKVGRAWAKRPRGNNCSIVGIPYDADISGDYCLGLLGGMVPKDVFNQVAARCRDSRMFVSGYSDGMVCHNAVAYANAVVVFGDPFHGAQIKGYKSPILTYCNPDDQVCVGNFIVTKPHMSYAGARTDQAAEDIQPILEDIETKSKPSAAAKELESTSQARKLRP